MPSSLPKRDRQGDHSPRLGPVHGGHGGRDGHEDSVRRIVARDRLAARPFGDIVDQHIVPSRLGKNAVHDVDEAENARLDPRLLDEFPQRRIDRARPGDYVALCAFLEMSPENEAAMAERFFT